DRFGPLLAEHPLRREIIATMASNGVVNSQGITFVSRMVIETGAHRADVVRAFRIARDVTRARRRRAEIARLHGVVDPKLQIALQSGVDWLVEATSRWYLVQAAGQRLSEAVGTARDAFAELAGQIEQIGPDAWREEHEAIADGLVAQGVPADLARRTAFQGELVHGPDIIAVSHVTGRSPVEVARGFFLLGERLQLDWVENQLEELRAGSRWQRGARQSMEDDLLAPGRALCERAVEMAGGAPIDEAIDGFLASRGEAVDRLQRFLRTLGLEGVTDLSQLTVALRQIRALAG